MKSRIQQVETHTFTNKMDLNLRKNYESVTFGAYICLALNFDTSENRTKIHGIV